MTLYFTQVFSVFSDRFGYAFHSTEATRNVAAADLALVHDGALPDVPDRFRGTHIVRDPRDLIVSGYFYHLRTGESWCVEPNPANDDVPAGVSYQVHLRSLPLEEGLIFEMEHVSGGQIDRMLSWNYRRPEFMELKFEDILGNERSVMERVFDWYGFPPQEAGTAGRIAARYAATPWGRLIKYLKGGRHIRPGARIGQWRDFFTPRVERRFNESYGEVVRYLGYAD